MTSNNSNQINIPESRNAMYNFKHEVANELGINLKQGYNGGLTSRDAGSIGGMMVNTMLLERQVKIHRRNIGMMTFSLSVMVSLLSS